MLFGAHLPWFGILLAAVVQMVIGMIWYQPKIFGDVWAASLNLPQKEIPTLSTILQEFVRGLIMAFTLALLIEWTTSQTSWEGALIGFWVGVGFLMTSQYGQYLWVKKPFQACVIETACGITSLIIMGALIGMLSD